jgi:hypothetical protein
VWLVVGCGGSLERGEIKVPGEVKKTLARIVPDREYRFYALAAQAPLQVEDLAGRTLLVCGPHPFGIDLAVLESSVEARGETLFQSSWLIYAKAGTTCEGEDPCFRGTTNAVFLGVSRSTPRLQWAYAEDTPVETISERCREELAAQPNMVVLVRRDGGIALPEDVVQVVFR